MSDKDQNSTQIAADSEHNRSSSSNNIGLKRKTARSEEEARDVRLEQNRVAARESRKRKKKMVEDLQNSIIFYTRANSMLKQQNDHMQRLIVEKTGQQAFSMSNINAYSTSNIDGNLDNSVPSEISTQQQLTFDVNAVSAALASGAVNANTTTAMQSLLPPSVYTAVMHQMLQSQQQVMQQQNCTDTAAVVAAAVSDTYNTATELAAAAAAAASQEK